MDDPNRSALRLATDRGWWATPRGLALLAATVLAIFLSYSLAAPFLPSITWAVALAIVSYPLHDWLVKHIKRANLAAIVAVAMIAFLLIAPGAFLAQRFAVEASQAVERVKTQTQSGEWRTTLESNPVLARSLEWIGPNVDVRSMVEQGANAIATYLSSFLGGSLWMLAQVFIAFYTLYFLLRDRRTIVQTAKSLVPLSTSDTDELFARVSDTIYATLYGNVATSVLQGILGGLMFWWLDLPAPLFWGTVMFLLSLIPALGSPVVWVPAAAFLALTGNLGKALILTAWGVLVIGSVDNLLYPFIVGDKIRLHTLLIFFSVVGGIMLFGTAGLVLGPVMVVVTIALIDVWQQRRSGVGIAEYRSND